MEINKDLIAASSTPIVLAILAEGDSYGYAILQRVRELSGGTHGVDRRDALPGAAPARAARPRRGAVGGRRTAADVASTTGSRRRAGRSSSRNAGSGRRWTRRLRGIWQALLRSGVGRAAAGGRLTMPDPDHARAARGADRPVAELPPPPAGDPRRSMSRSSRTICASRSPAWSTRGSPPMKHSWWRSSAWATSTPSPASSRASTPTASGSSSWSSRRIRESRGTRARTDAIVAFCLAVAAAVAIKVPALFGMQLDEDGGFYARNASLFVLPLLTGYFVWKRRLDASTVRWLAAGVRRGGCVRQRLSLRPGGLHRDRSPRCTCRSRSGWWWASRTPAAAGSRSRAAWTSSASRASSSSTTC